MDAGIFLAYKSGASHSVPLRHGDPEIVSMRADGWMRIVTPHHRKFRTAPGYIGIAPWIAQLHNAVCVLWGGKFPYIGALQKMCTPLELL